MYYLTRVGLFSSWIKTEKRIKQPTPKKQQPTIYIYIYIYIYIILYVCVCVFVWDLIASSAEIATLAAELSYPRCDMSASLSLHSPLQWLTVGKWGKLSRAIRTGVTTLGSIRQSCGGKKKRGGGGGGGLDDDNSSPKGDRNRFILPHFRSSNFWVIVLNKALWRIFIDFCDCFSSLQNTYINIIYIYIYIYIYICVCR